MTGLSLWIAAWLTGGCATNQEKYRMLVSQIHNRHIDWDGSMVGLVVSGMTESERKVLAEGKKCEPYLLEALNDDSRFVAAHVLLTFIHIHEEKLPANPDSASYWNHLRVHLYSDGHVEIPVEEKEKIKRLWHQR